ncbi:peptide-methionine (S)-S-oxide reductase MsrA [Clostridium gasigenes]|uniref:peptide-methionine (S)-S-oxide reductase MsrA n=1 Tax=Clostridium gasigenes TaxID=94869 RepID=UPI0014382822|nr:peptide-methionine (S)-S-oxide reductase MsrA [Clostridium gasigenes]NKF08320.1 peptide-methionine (S)-S-oxide reductase MsrA [Clostridium gasigenes]QSW20823.1 peptide-methionine (S)-S-oxide reductase MsrA [Clostridium gasigenes]
MKKIILAGGCFWGVEEFLSRIDGVVNTEVGYANGKTDNPTYEDICNANTYFAEVCMVTYDESKLKLEMLLDEYWGIINPTSLNKQGNDVGSQYRTGIYYFDESDLDTIIKSRENIQTKYEKKIVTEVESIKNYYTAEKYHQKYLKNNPNGYCHIKF